jgi:hypothetical protein
LYIIVSYSIMKVGFARALMASCCVALLACFRHNKRDEQPRSPCFHHQQTRCIVYNACYFIDYD